jgi:hypothetical protein
MEDDLNFLDKWKTTPTWASHILTWAWHSSAPACFCFFSFSRLLAGQPRVFWGGTGPGGVSKCTVTLGPIVVYRKLLCWRMYFLQTKIVDTLFRRHANVQHTHSAQTNMLQGMYTARTKIIPWHSNLLINKTHSIQLAPIHPLWDYQSSASYCRICFLECRLQALEIQDKLMSGNAQKQSSI